MAAGGVQASSTARRVLSDEITGERREEEGDGSLARSLDLYGCAGWLDRVARRWW
jgi:hypothetical protein